MEVPKDSAAAAAAMGKLQDLIADPKGREQFLADPGSTLSRSAVPTGDIPQPVLEVLQSLSPEELELISKLQTTLVENGLYVDMPAGGTCGFF